MEKNLISTFDDDVVVIRQANPLITIAEDHNHEEVVQLECGDFVHQFPVTTSVSEALKHYPIERIGQRFVDSTLVFKDGELMDHRYGNYNGIIHSDDAIRSFIEHVGTKPANRKDGMKLFASQREGLEIQLASELLGLGGDTTLTINFNWSVFQTHISSTIEYLRMVCMNGAMMSTPLLQSKVPVINDWQHHLNIAHTMLTNKTTSLLEQRVKQMYHTAAPLSLVQNVADHAARRLDKTEFLTYRQRDILQGVLAACDVVANSGGLITTDDIMDVDSHWADRMPTHINMWSLFNCATEIDSHTDAIDGSSTIGMRKLTNRILFSDTKTVIGRMSLKSPFNDPAAALMYHQTM